MHGMGAHTPEQQEQLLRYMQAQHHARMSMQYPTSLNMTPEQGPPLLTHNNNWSYTAGQMIPYHHHLQQPTAMTQQTYGPFGQGGGCLPLPAQGCCGASMPSMPHHYGMPSACCPSYPGASGSSGAGPSQFDPSMLEAMKGSKDK